jgi:hypothetical protein
MGPARKTRACRLPTNVPRAGCEGLWLGVGLAFLRREDTVLMLLNQQLAAQQAAAATLSEVTASMRELTASTQEETQRYGLGGVCDVGALADKPLDGFQACACPLANPGALSLVTCSCQRGHQGCAVHTGNRGRVGPSRVRVDQLRRQEPLQPIRASAWQASVRLVCLCLHATRLFRLTTKVRVPPHPPHAKDNTPWRFTVDTFGGATKAAPSNTSASSGRRSLDAEDRRFLRLVEESGDPVSSTPAANAAGQGLGYLPVATRSAVNVQVSNTLR